jgi:hypothetical protein
MCARKITTKTGHLDHNHVTGKLRGLLCLQCNMALGLLNDDKAKITGLMTYLEEQ